MPTKTMTLLQAADAILETADIDALTGEKKDADYRRSKRAEARRARRDARARAKTFGKLGPASPVRIIPIEG